MSSGLITLLTPHLSAPNAFLEQSQDPFKYDDLIRDNPQVKLWFSGHNHLGQDYENAISKRHQCHFVHTGTMSTFSRDTLRQSRYLDISEHKISISTIDHNNQNLRLDAEISLTDLTSLIIKNNLLNPLGNFTSPHPLIPHNPSGKSKKAYFNGTTTIWLNTTKKLSGHSA